MYWEDVPLCGVAERLLEENNMPEYVKKLSSYKKSSCSGSGEVPCVYEFRANPCSECGVQQPVKAWSVMVAEGPL